MLEIVRGLRALRDRAYSAYSNHKDRNGETAQNNLKRYNELEELRKRVETEFYFNSDLKQALASV
jgi:hypothetical protein